MHGRGAGGDQDHFAPDDDVAGSRTARPNVRPGGLSHNPQRVRIDKRGTAVVEHHSAQVQPLLDALSLAGRDPLLVEHEVGHGRLATERQVNPVEVSCPQARDRQRRLAKGLAREGSRVGRGAPDQGAFLDHGNPLSKRGRRRRATLPRRPRANHHQIIS